MKVAFVLGTRPEIIKLAPLILACEKRKLPYVLIHTGQHYSYALDQLFFEELGLPQAQHHLRLEPSQKQGEQTARMIVGVEEVLLQEKPNVVLVEGDTNSVLAGALCASKLHIALGHVEAGLRSFDRTMPEELNRVVTDHLSDFLYVPTALGQQHALREGISKDKIFVTGNTIVESVALFKKRAEQSLFLQQHHLTKGNYFLVTAHRAENVDDKTKLQHIFDGLQLVAERYQQPIIYPLHPRTKKFIEQYHIHIPQQVTLIDPLGFFDFLQAEMHARLVLTDSGGVQEETSILGVPCVTLRENTERPETLDIHCNILVGTDPKRILAGVDTMLRTKTSWQHPFGDGKTSERILQHLQSIFS